MPNILAAKDLKPGDALTSATGKVLIVSRVRTTENRTVVLFDGDMEIDFNPFYQLRVERKERARL